MDLDTPTPASQMTLAELVAQQAALPAYRCHKVVRAIQIRNLLPPPPGIADSAWALTLFADAAPVDGVVLPRDFCERHNPTVGSYLVFYEDGYVSISPAGAFDAGYTAA